MWGKIQAVKVDGQGRVIIPEDIRKNLGIETNTILFLDKQENQIIMRREQDISKETDTLWQELRHRSLARLWDEQDEAWDKYSDEDPV